MAHGIARGGRPSRNPADGREELFTLGVQIAYKRACRHERRYANKPGRMERFAAAAEQMGWRVVRNSGSSWYIAPRRARAEVARHD